MMKANRLKHGGSTYSQADNAMPLSEPMKAAIVLGIVRALEDLTSAVRGKPIATYAGAGGFAGGLFEDRLDLD